jgi:hypothetical protein
MNEFNRKVKKISIGVAVVLIALAWGIGGYYKKGVFLGPYLLPNIDNPVYFEIPVINNVDENKDKLGFKTTYFQLGDFNKVAVYEISVASLLKTHAYPLSNTFPDPFTMEFHYISSLSVGNAEKIIDAHPKHPQYWLNRLQMAGYRVTGMFAWLIQYNQFLMAITGVLATLWVFFRHKTGPFLLWWGIVLVYGLIHRGLYDFNFYATMRHNDILWFVSQSMISPASMYPWAPDDYWCPGLACGVCFYIVGFLVFLIRGWAFLIDKVVPKLKCLIENYFLKFEKDHKGGLWQS